MEPVIKAFMFQLNVSIRKNLQEKRDQGACLPDSRALVSFVYSARHYELQELHRLFELPFPDPLENLRLYIGVSSLINSSLSCFGATVEGAPLKRQIAFWVFGNAITSRIDCAPTISINSLSSPSAMPP